MDTFLSWWQLDFQARGALGRGLRMAQARGHAELGVEHLLWGLVRECGFDDMDRILALVGPSEESAGRRRVSRELGRILDRASERARQEAPLPLTTAEFVGQALEELCGMRVPSPWPDCGALPAGALAAAGEEHMLGLLLHEPLLRRWIGREAPVLAARLLAGPPRPPYEPPRVERAPLTLAHLARSLAEDEAAGRLGVDRRGLLRAFGLDPLGGKLRPVRRLRLDGWRLGDDPGRPEGFHRCSVGWLHRDLPRLDVGKDGRLVAIWGRRLCQGSRVLLQVGDRPEVAVRRLGRDLRAVGGGVEVAARVGWIRLSPAPPS